MPRTYSLEEQLEALTPEQLEALKQELIKSRVEESGGTTDRGLLNREPNIKGLLGRGAIRALAAGAEGAVLGLQGRPISEGSFMKEKTKTDSGLGLYQQRRFELDVTREDRLAKESDIRQRRFEVENLLAAGGEIGDKEVEEAEKSLLQNLKPQLEAGRGIATIDKDNGERKWRVLSQQEWNNKISMGKFDSSEIEHLQNIRQEHRAWTNVKDRLASLGINPASAGKIEYDIVNSPIGPFSIPARFNLLAQYSQDPKYTAVKKDIELAFQAFRKRVTGAQASDRELKMLRPLIASLKDRPEVFFEIVNNAIENDEIAFNDRLDLYKKAGRDISQFEGLFGATAPGIERGQGNEQILNRLGLDPNKFEIIGQE